MSCIENTRFDVFHQPGDFFIQPPDQDQVEFAPSRQPHQIIPLRALAYA